MNTLITSQYSLEEKSLWYKYKTEVWSQETPEAATIHNTMRTFRSIHNFGELAYVSVPITTGKIFYENPTLTIKEIIIANYHYGWVFVDILKKRLSCPILYPADLIPARQKWSQSQFQALWLSLIAEFCTEVHMTEGWELSNGGIEELIHVFQLRLGIPQTGKYIFYNTKMNEQQARARMKNIKIFDHIGNPLTIEASLGKIQDAQMWLEEKGLSSTKLKNYESLLQWTQKAINDGFYQ